MGMSEKLQESFVGIDVSKNTLDLRIEPLGKACMWPTTTPA
jgi:hypothetical protein